MAALEFDVIVYGATGFTGKLVAEYLMSRYGVGGDVKWAIAGRDAEKLKTLRNEIRAYEVPCIVAGATDSAALDTLAHRARVVITTVGPYQRYGEGLLAACVRAGTDYVDLCGEPNWMAAMIARYEKEAKASGSRIVFSCGFDSIPFEGGVWFLQQNAIERTGAPLKNVRGRVRKLKGGASGGTMASMLATLEAARRDPSVSQIMADPFSLSPATLVAQPPLDGAVYDEDLDLWSGPFVMAAINTKNVHRSNALMNYRYGRDFTYDERMATGGGAKGRSRTKALVGAEGLQRTLLNFGPTRALLQHFALPKPGQGPSKEQRESGEYEVLFAGKTPDGALMKASVHGDRDPGYGSTSKMITETALCLAQDVPRSETPGGIWTPGAALGAKLITRLQERAGLTFKMLD